MLNSKTSKQTVRSRSLSGRKITLFIQRSLSVVGLFAILFAAGLNSSQAQGTWTQKADFGGTARQVATGFSINGKGYIGTGFKYNSQTYYKDFWEYDPATNAWTQKADFAGDARNAACGFSIGNKGYLGTGIYEPTGTRYKDFWEYDPVANTWTQKADFGGTAIYVAVGFSIGNKGYIGTGSDGTSILKDFWEYDPANDTWVQKADFGGTARYNAVGFSIGDKGYIGTGNDNQDHFKDFWEYDPATNIWIQKADYGGEECGSAIGFSIAGKGYIGTGGSSSGLKKEFWEYDPTTNIWTQKADFAQAIDQAVGFSIGAKGYIGTGLNELSWPFTTNNDFWEYTPDTTSCAAPTNLSVTNITSSAATINWDAVAGAVSYKVRYKVTGPNQWLVKNTTENFTNLDSLSPSTKYAWEVKTFCANHPGFSSDWSAKHHFTTAPLRMGNESLQQVAFQIYPNPAEEHATIQFTLPQSSHVSIKVFDVSGKEIGVLLDAELQEGEHSLPISTSHFSKGVYLVRMSGDFGTVNQKLIVQ